MSSKLNCTGMEMEATCDHLACGDTDTIKHLPIPDDILEFARQHEMNIVHINAQRELGPPIHVNPHLNLERGSEVYLGNIPRNIYEPEILPFMEQVGQVYKLRLMMDFSGTNKGYCFVQYFHPSQADLAVATLHKKVIKTGYSGVVCTKSVDNRKLVLGGVPTYKAGEEILTEIKLLSQGVRSVIVTWSDINPPAKGIIFVLYESHRTAALARKIMLAKPTKLWGYHISVDWAEPENELCSPTYSNKPQVIRVTNIAPTITYNAIMEIFNRESFNGIMKMNKFNTEAFIYFHSRSQAEAAKAALNGVRIAGNQIGVEWINPDSVPKRRQRRKHNRRVRFAKTVSVAMISSTKTVTAAIEKLQEDEVTSEPNDAASNEEIRENSVKVKDEEVGVDQQDRQRNNSAPEITQNRRRSSYPRSYYKNQRRERIQENKLTFPFPVSDSISHVIPGGLWNDNPMMNRETMGYETLLPPYLLSSQSSMGFPAMTSYSEIADLTSPFVGMQLVDNAPASLLYFCPLTQQQYLLQVPAIIYSPYYYDPLMSEPTVPATIFPNNTGQQYTQQLYYVDKWTIQSEEEATEIVMMMGQ